MKPFKVLEEIFGIFVNEKQCHCPCIERHEEKIIQFYNHFIQGALDALGMILLKCNFGNLNLNHNQCGWSNIHCK
jgi:hypothetical protein